MRVQHSKVSSRVFAAISGKPLWALALIAVTGCAPEVPAGKFACRADDDCPEGWSCGDNENGEKRCYPPGTDWSAIRDKGGTDPKDAGQDATPPSAPIQDGSVSQGKAGSEAPAAGSGGSQPPAAGSGGRPAPPTAGSPGPAPEPTNCETQSPDAQKGVFVATGGSTASNCGGPESPCASIEFAMDRALADKRKLIYVHTGTYAEMIELRAELQIQGSYVNDQGRWSRNCTADRAKLTRIESPTGIGLRAEYEGDASVEALTIATLTDAQPGHSSYGVFARGNSTRLRLREVHVFAAPGGEGPRGATGATPAPRSGTCVPGGDGANGETEGTPGTGAPQGLFDSSGYVPGDGLEGGLGVPGHNGSTGTSTCRNCLDACNPSTCSGNPVGMSCGMPGQAGCGGTPAAGGGGSSVALFVWGARVEVEGGLLHSGDGGSGGAGGEPGQGGAGSEGGLGQNGEACTICSKSTIIPIDPPVPTESTKNVQANKLPAADTEAQRPIFDAGIIAPIMCVGTKAYGVGGAGMRGGMGSSGGLGGSGAGGHSYGALAGGKAILDISNTTRIELGRAGRSEGNGAAGLAAEIKLLP